MTMKAYRLKLYDTHGRQTLGHTEFWSDFAPDELEFELEKEEALKEVVSELVTTVEVIGDVVLSRPSLKIVNPENAEE